MIHTATLPELRGEFSKQIAAQLAYDGPLTGRLTILRWNDSVAPGVTTVVAERLIKGPHRIDRLYYSQNVAQVGNTSVNLVLSDNAIATFVAATADILLMGNLPGVTTLLPSNFPQSVELTRAFNRLRSFYKAILVNSSADFVTFQMTLELTPISANP